ncbi:MAG: transcription-repair coupling factor [bacterium]
MLEQFLSTFHEDNNYKVSGLPGGAKAFFINNIIKLGFNVVIIEKDEDEALVQEDNIKALQYFFPNNKNAQVVLFPENDIWQQSLVLGLITSADIMSGKSGLCLVATMEACKKPLLDSNAFKNKTIRVAVDEQTPWSDFVKKLVEAAYQRVDFVESKGEFASRGEIVDVWPSHTANPMRIVFFENKIESIREFDVYTQRSHNILINLQIFPFNDSGKNTLEDYIEKYLSKTVLFIDEESENKPGIFNKYILYSAVGNPDAVDMGFYQMQPFNRDIEKFSEQLSEWHRDGSKTTIFSHTIGEEERLKELLFSKNPLLEKYPVWERNNLVKGFIYPAEKMIVVSNGEIFNRFQKSFRNVNLFTGRKLDKVGQLKAGDYAVHKIYGIGKYLGLKKLETDGSQGEYITLSYKNDDKLYVPVDDFKLIQKYVGVEGKRPRIYSLDGFSWERAKLKVKKSVEEFAKELLRTAALRASQKGMSFGEDSYLEKEFEHQFPYQETPDQSKSIDEVKSDMRLNKPMDRVLCGDVGYGKTEVALRASLKAVVNSTQVAILVPTTILAEQHFQTFSDRFADFPVKLEMLSRFRKASKQKKIIQDINKGLLDIVIGTHRLLQKDVVFKNLGLLIIDEEHRFGVSDKEKIKKFKENIDVLTMTATPIPRTLYMGFAGVKDLSIIETPPEGRQPIHTFVGGFSEEVVKKAFYQELNRNGQIFYVYNRVETMHSKLKYLENLLPGVRFAVVHGQMRSSKIEDAMYHFLKGDFDCLLSTSIIESGLDIPRVNTLIVENAQNLGLAQLYQLRGRVGRQNRQAYCYLFYTDGKGLTDEARKRLEALREFTELGSGFKLALRDLEIRGAGNILGKQQHGAINEIGFDFYAQLLKEEVEKLQGKRVLKEEEQYPELHLSLTAYLPEEYIPTDTERISYYKRILASKSEDDIKAVKEEMLDRFGSWGEEVENIFKVIIFRNLAAGFGVNSIIQQKSQLIIGLNASNNKLNVDKLIQLAQENPADIQLQEKKDVFIVKYANFFNRSDNDVITDIKNFLYKLV